MKKKSKGKIKLNTIIILLIIVIIIMLLLFIIFKKDNKLIGIWSNDDITIYEFKKDNIGYLNLPLGKYKFKYKVSGDSLYIDFKDKKSDETNYIYSIKKNELTLKSVNGTFKFKKVKKV